VTGGWDVERLLADQIRYYDDRAPIYEDLWFRRGAYDLGPGFARGWFRETAAVERAVDALDASGSVMELAAGTGLWTRRLAPRSRRYVALDSSSTALALNRERCPCDHVEWVEGDAFAHATDERFDLVFLGFFLSHVPPDRFDALWAKLARWLRPGGEVFVVDDRSGPDRPYSGDAAPDGPPFAYRRTLPGGRGYTIVKVFYSPEQLTERVGSLGWRARFTGTGRHFLYGAARPRTPR
jgi:demethylmenaquinone methyltransferase/2-methoxy-6-polyprenyl-1,4-benzoquinol methylase